MSHGRLDYTINLDGSAGDKPRVICYYLCRRHAACGRKRSSASLHANWTQKNINRTGGKRKHRRQYEARCCTADNDNSSFIIIIIISHFRTAEKKSQRRILSLPLPSSLGRAYSCRPNSAEIPSVSAASPLVYKNERP